MATLLDSYSESNQNAVSTTYSGDEFAGQSFTTPNDGKKYVLDTCKFYLKKKNATGQTGNCYAVLYAETHATAYGTDSIPTGSALATSDAIVAEDLSTSLTLQTFTFSGANRVLLNPNTQYCIELNYAGGNGSVTAVQAGYDTTTPTASGNYNDVNSGSWRAFVGTDLCFYVYGIATNIYTLTAIVGAFVLTGINVLLTWIQHYYTMTVTVGQFVLTGINIGAIKGIKMGVSTGQFILTGLNIIITTTALVWLNTSKSVTATFSNITKNIATMTGMSKSTTSTFLNQSIHTGTKTNQPKISTASFTNVKKT